ncbi:ABC transporter B family member 25 [Hordeum vulgare]|nr:ABC transporter B family member 25 [Hordeum vulgare]
MSPPSSFNRRETEEYDRHSTSFSSARSSYAGSSSSSGAGFLSVKREWSKDEEEPEEHEEPAPLGRRGVVGPEDYVEDFDAVAAAIAERSVHEEPERRRHAEKLEALQWQQPVTANVAANEKAEEWRRIRAEQAAKYVDLCSSGEED